MQSDYRETTGINNINEVTTRLHWTSRPYRTHADEGDEVLIVLDGIVEILFKEGDIVKESTLKVGEIFYASIGIEHVAYPHKNARILVVYPSNGAE